MEERSLSIPIRNTLSLGEKFVVIKVSELPDNVSKLETVLKNEIAPLGVWLEAAIEYYRSNRLSQCRKLLETSSEVNEEVKAGNPYYYTSAAKERIEIFSSLAALYVKMAVEETSKSAKKGFFELAIGAINKSEIVERQNHKLHVSGWIAKGVYFIAKSQSDDDNKDQERAKNIQEAETSFKNALYSDSSNVPGNLGLASILFNQGKYAEASEKYKIVLKLKPDCDASVRVALGYCYYKLNLINAAVEAFERALELDPTNINASVALGMIEIYGDQEENRTRGTIEGRDIGWMRLVQAFNVDNKNSLVLAQLADHYFWKWNEIPNVTAEPIPDSQSLNVSRDVRSEILRNSRIKVGNETYNVHPSDPFTAGIIPLDRQFTYGANYTPSGPLKIYQKKYDEVIDMARNSYHETTNDSLKAELHYFMARAHQAKRDFTSAFASFRQGSKMSPQFVLPLFGMAQAQVHKEMQDGKDEYKKAISSFKKVILLKPECWEAHESLGVLYNMTGNKREALKSIREAVRLAPQNLEALITLAEMVQQSGTARGYEEAIECYDRAQRLISERKMNVQFELVNNAAVLHAILRKYDSSERLFLDAFRLLVTLSGEKKLPENLIVTDAEKKSAEASAKVKMNEAKAAKKLLDGSATLQKSSSGQKKLIDNADKKVEETTEIWKKAVEESNVVYQSFSAEKFASVAATSPSSLPPLFFETNSLTISFNLACLYEKTGRSQSAEGIFHRILQSDASYVDCHLRLGSIEKKRGQIKQAISHFRKAENSSTGIHMLNYKVNAWLNMAEMQENNDLRAAKQTYTSILSLNKDKELAKDSYTLLALANAKFSLIQNNDAQLIDCSTKGKNPTETLLKEVITTYKQVLFKDSNNVYALMGLGCVLAQNKYWLEACDIFTKVRECAPECEDAWLNLAHVQVQQGVYLQAINLYKQALVKFHNGSNADIYNFLGNAYVESQMFNEAVLTMKKAIAVFPNDTRLWFNLARVSEQLAIDILDLKYHPSKFNANAKSYPCCNAADDKAPGCKTNEDRTYNQVLSAQDYLRSAFQIFKWLFQLTQTHGTTKRFPFEASAAKKHMSFCEKSLAKATYHVNWEKDKEEAKKKKEQELEENRKIWEENKRRATEEEEKERLLQSEQRETLAAQKERKLAELRKKWQEDEVTPADKSSGKEKKKGKKGKKRGKDFENFIASDDEDKKGKGGKKDDDDDDIFASDEDEGGKESNEDLFEGSDKSGGEDENGEGKIKKKEKKRKINKHKTKESDDENLFSDDDEKVAGEETKEKVDDDENKDKEEGTRDSDDEEEEKFKKKKKKQVIDSDEEEEENNNNIKDDDNNIDKDLFEESGEETNNNNNKQKEEIDIDGGDDLFADSDVEENGKKRERGEEGEDLLVEERSPKRQKIE